MKIQFNSIKIFITAIILFFVLNEVKSIGFGYSTNTLYFKDILRGGYAEFPLILQNPNDFDEKLSIEIDGDIKNWISFNPDPNTVTIPAHSGFTFIVSISPPIFVPNGVYTGKIYIIPSYALPEQSTGTGSAIIVGVGMQVFAEVSDKEIKNFTLIKLISDVVEECDPLVYRIWTKNVGNVELPFSYKVRLYNFNKTTFIKEFSQIFNPLKPTVVRRDYVNFPSDLSQFKCIPIGKYTAEIIGSFENTTFAKATVITQIVERGTLNLDGELLRVIHPSVGYIGEPIKLTGIFNNTGLKGAEGWLNIELYKNDKLISIIKSEKMFIEPESQVEIKTYYTPVSLGEHKIVGSVSFGGKSSNLVESQFSVRLGFTAFIILSVILLVIAMFIMLLLLYFRYKKER